jgi:hypothetical protein
MPFIYRFVTPPSPCHAKRFVNVALSKANYIESTIFWDITPCSPLNVSRRFGGTHRLQAELCLPPAFTLVSYSAYPSTLKMEAICSSETSADTQRSTWRYTPEYDNHRCENLKSNLHRLVSYVG